VQAGAHAEALVEALIEALIKEVKKGYEAVEGAVASPS
jgi:hypothetical protein